jgi:hypothetical protein
MKVERKFSDFSAKKWKRNENMKKKEICGTEMETEFFSGSENGNGTTFSGKTNAKTEVSVSD